MLRRLRIRQFAIIEDLTVEFADGLHLFTGETGAGKSIVVDALGLIAGRRADPSLVRQGEERAVVEAQFDGVGRLHRLLAEQGIDPDPEGQLTVRRDLPASGSGRVFVNGSPSTVGVLKRVAAELLELHGQHQQQHLQSPRRHLALLDAFGGHREPLGRVAAACARWRELRRERAGLAAAAGEAEERAARLREQILEIDAVAPQDGERDALEREAALLRNAGRIAEGVEAALDACDAADRAGAAARELERLAEFDPLLGELAARSRSAQLELADIADSLRGFRDGREFDPQRLEEVESRRAAIDRLCLRYGSDEAEVHAWRTQAAEELQRLSGLDERLAECDAQIAEALAAYANAAAELSRARREAAQLLVHAVEEQLQDLALDKARLSASWSEVTEVDPAGAERVEWLFSANPGEDPRPLARIASGGELSRLMLAFYLVLDHGRDGGGGARTLIFDEVDSGISGAVADAVGARLAELSSRRQLLCVTHLPQVAAHGEHHYHVSKQVRGGRTRTSVERLAGRARVEALAHMLGGRDPTDASRRNASAMLRAAAAPQGNM